MIRRHVAYALIAVALLTLLVWAVSQFIQPILPSSINSKLLALFAALASVAALMAGFKDIVELFHLLSERRNRKAGAKVRVVNFNSKKTYVSRLKYRRLQHAPEIAEIESED